MRPTPLPTRPRQRGRDRVDEPGVSIRGDELDAGETAGDERAQEGEPGGAILGGDDVEPERLPEAVAVDGDRVHDAGVDRPAALPALDLERVQDEVRVGRAVERARAEVLDDPVQRFRKPGDLAAAHPLDPELADELVDASGGYAGEVGIRDHRHERLLRPPASLEKPVGEVRALPELGDRKLDRADARVPAPLPVAVSDVDPRGRALAEVGATEHVGLGAHQRLGKLAHHLPQEIRARLFELLAQPTLNVHRHLDHRAPPRFVFDRTSRG